MASELARAGITLAFMLKLSLAGMALFGLVQAAKMFARHRRIAPENIKAEDETR
ncbi:DedA family inner membrane protein YdjX [Raoultella terrigena]|nr:DedA family inner membrane protein YdjX [Raoultella terrigena]